MKLIDTHAHLDQLTNVETALENAYKCGVDQIIAVSMSLESSFKTWDIAQTCEFPRIHPAMGMHPAETNLNDLEACAQLIEEHHPHLIAIGEIGLDFWYKWVRKDEVKKNEQREAFRFFLSLAKKYDLPAVIHSRGAWQECLDTVVEMKVEKAEFHWYSGPIDVLDQIIDHGFMVSTSPSVAYSEQSREAMKHAPLKSIMVETDTPVYYRNKHTKEEFLSEPKDVFKTLSALSVLKNVTEEQLADIVNLNAQQFFSLA